MKKAAFILLCLLVGGCGSSLKNSWTNFTAYYNTYYNAKEDFDAGRDAVERIEREVDTGQPVRPHPTPPLAGEADFNRAVENAAQVLRRFPDSKWADDALLLIGQSYYYLQEYFLALQKFEELLDLPGGSPLQPRAVIWKGRTLLDIGDFVRGQQFMDEQLSEDRGWTPQSRAEAAIVRAEHLAMLEQWEQAAGVLEPALLHIERGPLRGRSYFLLGQLFERQQQLDKAFQAYSNVSRNFPAYTYSYQARLREARVARKMGNTELAVSLYLSMLRDDKNFERRSEINYALARTYREQDRYVRAEALLLDIVSDKAAGAPRGLISDAYYALGELYSERYYNYEQAAAYFDSARTRAVRATEEERRAGELATAYSRYVALKAELARADSLLRLGALGEQELQAELVKIREQRRRLLQQSGNAVQQTNNVLVNRNENRRQITGAAEEDYPAARYGFLNYRSPQLARQDLMAFRAEWGDRPRVDHWRREAAIAGTAAGGPAGADSPPQKDSTQRRSLTLTDEQLGIDLNELPRTNVARDRLSGQKQSVRYRLGSLFFLTLNQPDSAAHYFRQVLQGDPPPQLTAQTLYSLYEVYHLNGPADSAAVYRRRVLEQYPDSRFAGRIRGEPAAGAGRTPEGEEGALADTTAQLRRLVQPLLQPGGEHVPDSARAERLIQLAETYRSSPLASEVYYEGLRQYIRFARSQAAEPSSEAPPDTVGMPPGGEAESAYSGARWNRVRALIRRYLELFPEGGRRSQLNVWLQHLAPPPDEASA